MPLYNTVADLKRDGYFIVTPEDRELSLCKFVACEEQPSLGELQTLIGGYIECVGLLTAPKVIGVVDEEGKMKKKPRNVLATLLLEGSSGEYIVGTMLIMCGKAILR